MKSRIIYFILICCIIFIGITSRQIPVIPLYIGDVLWAVMIFFIVRFILIKSNIKVVTITSLVICYLVEASQLYQAEWINIIRNTLLGKLILGQGFLWSDIAAYSVGVIIAFVIELLISIKVKKI